MRELRTPMKQSHLLLFTIAATAALYVLSFVALGQAYPTVESSGQEIIAWFSQNGVCARTYAWMSALVSFGLTVFGGLVANALPRPHRYIFLGGALGFAITAQVQAWIWAALALHPHALDPGTARILFNIVLFWGPVVNASMVAMAAPVAALGFGKGPTAPRWLTWIAVIFGAEQAIETITIFGQKGFIAPGGPMNVYLGGMLGFIFIGCLVAWAMPRLDRQAQADKTASTRQ
ncbi:MAG: hypothetical protein AAF405_06770 [Pseudomonadota bacterium]